jgi:hypothetical protein
MKYIFDKSNFLLLEFIDNAKKILSDNNTDVTDESFLKIKEITKSNPSYVGLLTHYVFNMNGDINEVSRVFDLIKKYSQLLKNNNISPIEMIYSDEYLNISNFSDKAKKLIKSNKKIYRYFFLEELEDKLKDIIIDNDKSKFVKKFISNKYKHLINDKTKTLFYELKEIGNKLKWDNPHKKIQSLLTDKLIIFKTPEDLNSALEKVIEQIKGGWNTDDVSEMVIESGATVVHKDDRFVIVDVNEDSDIVCELGSPKWCIVYSKSQFNNYLEFPNKQYIIYDTYIDRTDNKSMIGATIKFNKNELGLFYTAHDRSDDSISEKYLKDLGIRKYLKKMSIGEIRANSDNFSWEQKIKYHLNDILIDDLEGGVIDVEKNIDGITRSLINYSNLEVFKFFYGNFNPNINKIDYVSIAVKDLEVLEYLLNNIDPNIINSTGSERPILQAIDKNNIEVVKKLIEFGFSVDGGVYNPIRFAVKNKNLEMVKLLMENGSDPTKGGNKSIKLAVENKSLEIVKFLYGIEEIKKELKGTFQQKRIEKMINKNNI